MTTKLFDEILEIPVLAERAVDVAVPPFPPVQHLYTLARGSSDHAAQVINRMASDALGIPASAIAPSQIHGISFDQSLVLAISQSGASPDLVSGLASARASGAVTVGLINQPGSALQAHCDLSVPMMAGPEHSVAATKSFFMSVLMGYRILYPERPLPSVPVPSLRADLTKFFVEQQVITVLGRGETLGLAREVALKVQELLGKPAFAYSSAEVVHGPKAMVMEQSAVLVLSGGRYRAQLRESARDWGEWGCSVHVCETGDGTLDALYGLPSLYLALESACRTLGRPVDQPVGLNKVTLTE